MLYVFFNDTATTEISTLSLHYALPIFAVVNVTLAGATVPSVRSELVNPIVTFAVGWLFRTTVNVAVPPASVVVSPEEGGTVNPATPVTDGSPATSLAFR